MLITMYNCCSQEECYVPIWASSRCCHQKITMFTLNMFKISNSQLPNMCSKPPYAKCSHLVTVNIWQTHCYNGASSYYVCGQARTLQTFLRTINNLYYLRRLLLNKEVINLSAQVLIQMAQSHSSDFQEINTHESSCKI